MVVIMRISHASRGDNAKVGDLPIPRVMRDIEPYASPIDGKMISSRSSRREDLKANDCVEYEPIAKREKGYSNPHFARKRGLPLNEAGQAKLDTLKKNGTF